MIRNVGGCFLEIIVKLFCWTASGVRISFGLINFLGIIYQKSLVSLFQSRDVKLVSVKSRVCRDKLSSHWWAEIWWWAPLHIDDLRCHSEHLYTLMTWDVMVSTSIYWWPEMSLWTSLSTLRNLYPTLKHTYVHKTIGKFLKLSCWEQSKLLNKYFRKIWV